MNISLMFWVAALLGCSSSGYAAAYECNLPAGSLQSLSIGARLPRFIVVGEYHGTNEAPVFFSDLTCLLSKRAHLVVALEYPKSSQAHLQRFIDSSGFAADRAKLLESSIWDRNFADGRGSEAMLRLIDRLRFLRREGADIVVRAFLPDSTVLPDQEYYELSIAFNWLEIASEFPDATVLILTGKAHARAVDDSNFGFLPAVGHLARKDVITLIPEEEGGAAWNLNEAGGGVHPLPGRSKRARGFYPDRTSAAYDGTYAVGHSYSASPPAANE